jgi:hypothetical protein
MAYARGLLGVSISMLRLPQNWPPSSSVFSNYKLQVVKPRKITVKKSIVAHPISIAKEEKTKVLAKVSLEAPKPEKKVVKSPTAPSPSTSPSPHPLKVPSTLLSSPPLVPVPVAPGSSPFPAIPSPIVSPPSSPFLFSPSRSPSTISKPECSIRSLGASEGVSLGPKQVYPPPKPRYSLRSYRKQVNDSVSQGRLSLDPIQHN